MHDGNDDANVSRRRLLRASAGTAAFSVVGVGQASASGADAGGRPWFDDRCPEATLEPSMGHCDGASMEGCDDDHPETVALREAVQESLAERYPDASALVDAGFKPYFDTLDRDADGWSHWINPDYVGDDSMLDPERPESVLVDNETWRSIGVMFIATEGGEAVDVPPAVYDETDGDDPDEDRDVITGEGEDLNAGDGERDSRDEHDHDDGHERGDHSGDDHEGHDDHAAHDGDDGRCAPWHYHAGLPGRFAWWYYQQVYEQDFADGGLESIRLPCRTPCMMHVWAVDHPEGVYAHDGPPREYRDDEPAAEAGFDNGSEPESDDLDWDSVPDDVTPDRLPDELAALVPGL
ncbi:hypothetical protein [Natronolimnohabitans innermongolicus]|uniref:Uncharacterized protein n=1 Tax=Natronolimnohabitans innermongolicus JCM 12255 TaxID=1227499 RepID=L9XC21_9EURY|nr:hypothetical protein [Natronolimnohabitans innermongolicus]ELY58976.1 hypothetical protein C493_06005 [Natronolimnohabitans innermongolicus JCM 12255]